MEFFEADDPAPPRRQRAARRSRGPRPPRGPSGASREIIVRRLIALGIGLLILILLLLAVRGCLNARKERAFDDYLRDLSALVANTNQLSQEFFGVLSDPGDLTGNSLQAQISSYRGAADDLLRRAQGLDQPDQLSEAQSDLVLAYELRAEAMRTLSNQIPNALGRTGRAQAIDGIVEGMRVLLASDVLYRRARDEMIRVLEEEEISGEVPQSVFLTDPTNWLDRLGVGAAMARIAGATGAAGDGVHGTEIASTTMRPGNVDLNPDSATTVQAQSPEVEVSVLNGGDTPERDVVVSYELAGGGVLLQGDATIGRIPPGQSRSTRIAIEGDVPTGEELVLTVVVQPVPGEEISENNSASYPIIFE